MPKLSKTRVGDFVLLKGEIVEKFNDSNRIMFEGRNTLVLIDERECEQIIPRPWTPKIGDEVKFIPSGNASVVYTIQGLFDGKAWLSWEDPEHAMRTISVAFDLKNYALCQ